jgi:hypothetical protein
MVERELLTQVEAELREKFETEGIGSNRLPSTAQPAPASDRLDQLFLPEGERPKMPLTKDKYVVRDNPHKVAWERVTRQFLRNLSLTSSHRISAVMVYEWATGIRVVDAMARAKAAKLADPDDPAGRGPSHDLRKINEILRFYFGKSYITWIAGRKVPNAYRVPQQWRIKYHRPMTLTLWNEYTEGVLNDDGARRNSA